MSNMVLRDASASKNNSINTISWSIDHGFCDDLWNDDELGLTCIGLVLDFLPSSSTCPNSKVMEKQQWDIKGMTEVQLGTPVSSFNLLPFFAEVIFFALVCKMRPISLSHFILEFLVRVSSNFIKPLWSVRQKLAQSDKTNKPEKNFQINHYSLAISGDNVKYWFGLHPAIS